MLLSKRLYLNLLIIVTLFTLKVILGDQPTAQMFLDYLQIKIIKVNPHRDRYTVVLTVWSISKQNFYQIIHQRFGHVSVARLKLMAKKSTHGGSPIEYP